MTTAPPPRHKAFSALSMPGYRAYLATLALTMMADNIEHVISYWIMFRKFQSEELGGFAVIAHWLPYLGFSVWVGALNDRFDSRRIIQAGALLFMFVSAGWGYFFLTDSLEMWHAEILLVLHGFAGVLWITSSQVLLYKIVGPEALASAVRLAASARYLGMLVGPAIGSIIMRTMGPTYGILFNVLFYVPLIVWLVAAPYGPRAGVAKAPRRGIGGLGDILRTLREVRAMPVVAAMCGLAGAASFFVGNSYQAQMPAFAEHLGHGDPGAAYMMLLGADAAGALTGGLVLELRGKLLAMHARSAMALGMVWATSLAGFALTGSYPLAIVLLFVAGFSELSFSSMAQTIVQMNAPDASRGRVLGLYNMAAAGLRMFSGITVGLVGGLISIHTSLPISAGCFLLVIGTLLVRFRAPGDSAR